MKIESSAVSFAASSYQSSVVSKTESLQAWDNRGAINDNTENGNLGDQAEDYILSLDNTKTQSVSKNNKKEAVFEMSDQDRAKITLLAKMIERLTGKKLRILIPVKWVTDSQNCDMQGNESAAAAQPAQGVGWGINYSRTDTVTENAQMSFSADGAVKTADGREINFSLDLNVSRSFVQQESLTIRAGDALLDPLVVNFDASSAELTGQKYSFDLDNDGNNESISFVQQGSGFLALDKNGDGTVNNGGELFGPSTGNGFMELKDYDSDGNGWIDENDPIYENLQIWTKNEQGADELFAIGQAGIGAIYVNGINSSFELKDASNELQGQIKQTGIFLHENGTAGTIQNVDLVV